MGNCFGSDEDFKDGQDKERNPRSLRRNVCCTDIIMLIIYIAFWCFLLFIAVYALAFGDPRRIIYSYDSSGNTCGVRNNRAVENMTNSGLDTSSKPKLFFMDTIQPLMSMQVCVAQCPDRKLLTKSDVIDFYRRTNVSLCQYGVTPDMNVNFGRTGPCPSLPIFKSISVLSRCVPDPVALINNTHFLNITAKFNEVFQVDELLTKLLSDIMVSWKELLALCFIALAVSILMVIMMRFLAAIIVYLIVVLAIIGSLVGTGFLWWAFAHHQQSDIPEVYQVPLFGQKIRKRTFFLIFAIIATILTVILILVLIILRKRISLVVALFKEAGKCIADIPLLLIQPLWTFFLLLFVFLYFMFIFACISTIGTPTISHTRGFPRVKYHKSMFVKQFWWIYLFGWCWSSEFVLACQEFIISSTVSIWYFTQNKKTLDFPILKSIKVLILHHMGSIAFGSLIIAFIKFLRYLLMYIQSKCKGSENACARCCLKCCICCLWCLENVLKYLHQNAYTIIAIEGTNFCTSAKKAFNILMSNALRVAAINSVGDFVLFLGKLGVTSICFGISIAWLRTKDDLNFVAVPVFIVCVYSFLIAHCFLSVYEMVIDALLICFCEDCEKNDGSPGREYFMSRTLMEFVTNSSAQIDRENKPNGPTGEETELTNKLSP